MSEANFKPKKERVVVYIDGFNLYFGIIDAGFEKYKWLNLNLLSKNLLRPDQELSGIKYFTSRISNNPVKQKRQSTYIEALESVNIRIYYGNYQSDTIECRQCRNIWPVYHEKMTDVNIATQIIIDAYQDKYDMAMLISGDSDLVPPIRTIHEWFPKKEFLLLFHLKDIMPR